MCAHMAALKLAPVHAHAKSLLKYQVLVPIGLYSAIDPFNFTIFPLTVIDMRKQAILTLAEHVVAPLDSVQAWGVMHSAFVPLLVSGYLD